VTPDRLRHHLAGFGFDCATLPPQLPLDARLEEAEALAPPHRDAGRLLAVHVIDVTTNARIATVRRGER